MDAFDTRYFRINKLLLSYVGLWPIRSVDSSNRNIILYCVILGILTLIFPQIAYLLKHASLADFYDVLPTLTGASICFMKVISLFYKSSKFRTLLRHVRYDWRLLESHEDIRILMEYAERSRMFTMAYLIFIGTGAISYVTAPLTVPIIDVMLASNVTRLKRLPHSSEFFLDPEEYYYLLFAITCVGSLASGTAVIAIDTIYFALLQHCCAMLAILSHRLKHYIVKDESKYVDDVSHDEWRNVENMVQCVQLQIRVERLIQLIESTFAMCLIIDVGLGVLFQCSACVMIVTHMNAMEMMKNGPLLLLQISRIFFNSWIGQEIIDHSSQVPIAAYNGMWYETSLKAKKMFLFLLMKCQQPYRITMAKLYVISLEGYSAIMKTSVSYVTLMISLNSDDV